MDLPLRILPTDCRTEALRDMVNAPSLSLCMESLLTVIGIAFIAFLSTNIDDIFLLFFFFTNRNYSRLQVVIGQYLGITLLVAVSSASYFLKFIIPVEWIGLLGLFPVLIGIQEIFKRKQHDEEENMEKKLAPLLSLPRFLIVASITIANGGDNIALYIPLFATLNVMELFVTIAVFWILIGIWCFAIILILKYAEGKFDFGKFSFLLPIVLIVLGISIMYHSGTFHLIF